MIQDLEEKMKDFEKDMTIAISHRVDEDGDSYNWEGMNYKEVMESLTRIGMLENCGFEPNKETTSLAGTIGKLTIDGHAYDVYANIGNYRYDDEAECLTLYAPGGKIIDLSDEKTSEMHKANLNKLLSRL